MSLIIPYDIFYEITKYVTCISDFISLSLLNRNIQNLFKTPKFIEQYTKLKVFIVLTSCKGNTKIAFYKACKIGEIDICEEMIDMKYDIRCNLTRCIRIIDANNNAKLLQHIINTKHYTFDKDASYSFYYKTYPFYHSIHNQYIDCIKVLLNNEECLKILLKQMDEIMITVINFNLTETLRCLLENKKTKKYIKKDVRNKMYYLERVIIEQQYLSLRLLLKDENFLIHLLSWGFYILIFIECKIQHFITRIMFPKSQYRFRISKFIICMFYGILASLFAFCTIYLFYKLITRII